MIISSWSHSFVSSRRNKRTKVNRFWIYAQLKTSTYITIRLFCPRMWLEQQLLLLNRKSLKWQLNLNQTLGRGQHSRTANLRVEARAEREVRSAPSTLSKHNSSRNSMISVIKKLCFHIKTSFRTETTKNTSQAVWNPMMRFNNNAVNKL